MAIKASKITARNANSVRRNILMKRFRWPMGFNDKNTYSLLQGKYNTKPLTGWPELLVFSKNDCLWLLK
jgi:hypothetical protein